MTKPKIGFDLFALSTRLGKAGHHRILLK